MKCYHNYVEAGTDLEMYMNNRNNFVRCLECNKVLFVRYDKVD